MSAAIDGFAVDAGTSDDNVGRCVPVGTDPGGRFAAWEKPEAFVAGLRAAVALA